MRKGLAEGSRANLLRNCVKNYYLAVSICIKGLILSMGLSGSHCWHLPHNSPQPDQIYDEKIQTLQKAMFTDVTNSA